MDYQNIFPDYSAQPLRLKKDVIETLRKHALDEEPREACGIISGDKSGDYDTVHRIRNSASDPMHQYTMDAYNQLITFDEIEARQKELVAIYHSRHAPKAFLSISDQAGYAYSVPIIILSVQDSKVDEMAIYSYEETTNTFHGRLIVPDDDISKLISIRTLADNPIDDISLDLLGYREYAAALAEFIRSRDTTTPFAVGIEGKWGSGKTSLMNLIRKRLEAYGLVTVFFNAWRYDKREELVAALASSIMDQVTTRWNWFDRLVFADNLSKRRLDSRYLHQLSVDLRFWFGLVVCLFLITLLVPLIPTISNTLVQKVPIIASVLSSAGLVLSIVRNSLNPFSVRLSNLIRDPEYRQRAGFLEMFREDFGEIIKLIQRFESKKRQKGFLQGIQHPPNEYEGEAGRVVVFIDDLDRCAPDSICEVLQAINLTLGSRGTVFVLGMDMAIVEAAVAARYKDIADRVSDSTQFHNLFLEKILQLRFKIPGRKSKTISYLDSLISHSKTNKSPLWERPESSDAYSRYIHQVNDLAKKIEETAHDVDGIGEAMRKLGSKWEDIPKDILEEARRKAFSDIFKTESTIVRKAFISVSDYLEGNPRNIKRFLNLFRLRAAIVEVDGGFDVGLTYEDLARWVVLSMRWPNVIRKCEEDPKFLLELSNPIFQKDQGLSYFLNGWQANERAPSKISLLCEY